MPTEIIPHLFLGDANDAIHASIDVKLVVNCTKNLPFYSPETQKIRIDVDDDGNEVDLIQGHWTESLFDAITNQIMQEHDVLIHCQMGRQRSAATVVAFLMHALRWPLNRAIEHVKSKKRDAFFPAVNFMKPLVEYSVIRTYNES
jgi:protein-tyrosine phosphatase